RGGVHHVDGFGVPPKIEFAPVFRGPVGRHDGSDAATHHDELLRQIGNRGIDADGLRDIREWASRINRYLMRVFVNHANDEMRGILTRRLRRRISLDELRDFEGRVVYAPDSVAKRFSIPRAFIGDFAIELFPAKYQFFAIDEREDGAGDDGNIGAANKLEHAK